MNRIVYTLLLVVFVAQISMAQVKVWESLQADKPIQCQQWEVIDVIYHVKEAIEKPFSKQAYAVVTGEEGTQRIPLFYNGGNKWVFRYSSATVGHKSFVLESEIKELNGKLGTLVISESKKPGRHGGIVLNQANPRHFFYEDETHYFNLAFECDWLFALDYGQKEIPKTKHLLSLLHRHGFNQIVMNVYSKSNENLLTRGRLSSGSIRSPENLPKRRRLKCKSSVSGIGVPGAIKQMRFLLFEI